MVANGCTTRSGGRAARSFPAEAGPVLVRWVYFGVEGRVGQDETGSGVMRRTIVVVACVLVSGAVPMMDGVAHAAGTPSRSAVTVNIVGTESFRPNGESATYRFPDAATKVQHGGYVTFVNQSDDVHTIALVAPSAVPTSFVCPLCDAVNGMYFPTNNPGPPSIFQIDNGVGSDDTDADVDATDPAAAGVPFPGVLTEDFDTPGFYAGDGSPVVGDSTLNRPERPP